MRLFLINFLILVLVANASSQEGQGIDRVIGIVGENIILRSEVEAQYVQFAASGAPVTKNTRCDLYEDLLYQKLLLNQAKIDSIEIGEAQIQSEIDRRLRYFVAQLGSEKKLEEFYDKSIVEIKEEFHDLIEEQLMIQAMEGKITDGVTNTPAEVREYFNSIPKDSLPHINSEVVIAQIVKKPPISEKEKLKAKMKLEGIRERIMKGEDFGTMAVLYSEDPGSAKNNGELGFTPRSAFVPEFSAMAFRMKEDQISEIVETEYGYHVLQLLGRRGDEVNVRHILISPKVNPQDLVTAKQYLDSIQNIINTEDTMTFELAAKLFSDDKETKQNGGKLVNLVTGTSTFEMDQLGQMDPTISFTLDKMEPGDISKPMVTQLADGTQAYRLIKLVKRTKPHVANLTDDYQKIQEVALMKNQSERLERWINKKIEKTYVRIDEDFQQCEFQNNWVVEQP